MSEPKVKAAPVICVDCGGHIPRHGWRGPQKLRCLDCHAELHRIRQLKRIRAIRASDPAYREMERLAGRKRMRKLRSRPDYQRPDA